MDKKKEIFRKNTLERISSPDKLNDYIRISRPSIWIVLFAILILVAVGIFWAFTAEITSDGLRPIDFLFN
jgi:hypothetical protein